MLFGKRVLSSVKNFLPVFEMTFMLYGGLNQVTCLFLDLLFVVSFVLSPLFSVVSLLQLLLVLIVLGGLSTYHIPSISSAISNKRAPPPPPPPLFPSKQHLKNTTFENKRFLLNSNSKHLLSDRSDDNNRQHMETMNDYETAIVISNWGCQSQY